MRFYEKRFAEEYNCRLTEEGYPSILLDKIIEQLKDSKTIIDVGAGSGFFTIPLANSGYKVTAVEPSLEMINLMKTKIDKNCEQNITISQSLWTDWRGRKHDALLSIHSIYPMQDKEESLKKMIDSAELKLIVISKFDRRKSLTEILRQNLKPGRPARSGMTKQVFSLLEKWNISYKIIDIPIKRVRSFSDIKKEADYYIYHIGLHPSSLNKTIDLLKEHTLFENGKYFFTSDVTDQMVII